MESDLRRMIGTVLEEADRPLTAAEVARAVAEHTRWEMRGWPVPPSRVEAHLADGFDGWVENAGERWCLRPRSLWPDAAPFWRSPDATAPEVTTDAVRGVLASAFEPLPASEVAEALGSGATPSTVARVLALLQDASSGATSDEAGRWRLAPARAPAPANAAAPANAVAPDVSFASPTPTDVTADQVRRVLASSAEPLSALAVARTLQPGCRSPVVARVQAVLDGPLAAEVVAEAGQWRLAPVGTTGHAPAARPPRDAAHSDEPDVAPADAPAERAETAPDPDPRPDPAAGPTLATAQLDVHLRALRDLATAHVALAVLATGPASSADVARAVGTDDVAEVDRVLQTALARWVARDADGAWTLADGPRSARQPLPTQAVDGPAAFTVAVEAGRIVVALNRSHPAHGSLAGDGARLLLESWAAVEAESPPSVRDRAAELREEWGRAMRARLRR